jgi:hypothetical protein
MNANFEKWLYAASPLAEVTRIEMTDPVDLDTPLSITLAYRIPDYAAAGEDELVLTPLLARYLVENGRLNDYRSAVDKDSRNYDIFLRCTRKFEFSEETELPAGYLLASHPDLGSEDGEAASFEAGVKMKGKMLTFDEQLVLKKKVIPVADYPGFKKAVEAMNDLGDLQLVFSKKGS